MPSHHSVSMQAALQQCPGLRLLEVLTHNSWKVHKAYRLTHHFLCTQAAIQQCQGLRLLELLTHISWKVDGPGPLKMRETIITHLFKQLPSLKACLPGTTPSIVHQTPHMHSKHDGLTCVCEHLIFSLDMIRDPQVDWLGVGAYLTGDA